MLHNRYIVLLVQDVLMRDLTNNNAPVLTLIPAQLQVFSQWVRLHCIHMLFFFFFFVFYILASFYDPHKPESPVLGPVCHG